MKQVDEMPTSGQFVAVWIGFDGRIWSDTVKWKSGSLYSYNLFNDSIDQSENNDNFTELETEDFYKSVSAAYFIADK